jgi:hypothetical protein
VFDFDTAFETDFEKRKKKFYIFRMLKHFNVNLQFIKKTLKTEVRKMHPKKKTGRKCNLRTKKMVKKMTKGRTVGT